MSTTAEAIRSKAQTTVNVDGHEFICYRWNAALALQAFGGGSLAVVEQADGGGPAKIRLDLSTLDKRMQAIAAALRVAMISPRLAEEGEDSAGQDAVTMRELEAAGDLATKLFTELTGGSAAKARDFPESSEGQEDSS